MHASEYRVVRKVSMLVYATKYRQQAAKLLTMEDKK